MKRGPKGSLLVDRLHKGFVLTCIAVTVYGCSVLAMRGYRYYTDVRPQLQKKQLLEQQNLLAEGSSEGFKATPEIRA
ncbi:uncharacterized protein LOC135119657 [Zophobas morio]|uniref:uncharacterized protein LOC135119657 n=1 Tax=Zophobas morio TaxID=2755281 RepID=UPI003083C22A